MTARRLALVAGLAAAGLLAGCGGTAMQPQVRSAAGSASPASTPAAPRPHHRPRVRLRVRPLALRLPVPLGREAVVDEGRYAVVAGGMLAGDTSTAAAYRLDLGRLRTGPMRPMPVPVHDTAGSLAAGTPIVIGGGNAVEQSVVQAWNGTRWTVVGHLPQARSDLVAARVGGRTLVLGGYNGSRPAEPEILASRTGRSWTGVGTLPLPVRYAAATVADGAIWLLGGERSGLMQTAIQRVDPRTGAATIVGRLPVPTGHAVAMAIGGRILVAGGRIHTEATLTDRMWWFDPRSRRVTPAGRLPFELADSAVVRDGDGYLLVGGETPTVTDRVLRVSY